MDGYPGYNHGHNPNYPPPQWQGGYDQYQQHDQYPPPNNYGPPSGPPPNDYGAPSYPPQHDYGAPSYPPPNNYGPPSGPPPPQDYNNHYGYAQSPPPQHGGHNYDSYNRGAGAIHAPPSGQQQFGHGAPEGYTFQYSNCQGRRKALLVGINYFGQKGELRGCINDVKNVSHFLSERYGYKRDDMVILTDDQQNPMSHPTKQNILRAIGWLVNGAQPNDSLFFHYSGHGGQTQDLDGDELDGTDEVIYPVDYQKAGHIVDDELHQLMVNPLQAGVRLTAIFDSCHSGSVLDLPYVYSTKGVLKEPNLAKEAGQGLLSAVSAYAKGDLGGVASSIFGFAKNAFKGDGAYEKTIQTKTSPADVIMWSGSKDDQTSADATIASQATGAMSYAFISAIKQNSNQSYVQLLNSIREILETKYSQKPQLSCSHPLDTNLLFVM